MLKELIEKKEKKVEYTELIYDLIFVYIIGRNNLLLHHFSGGFVEPKSFISYILCTLAVIQIWNYTTYYINMFGRNGVRDHIFLFINMYLLYFIGESTRTDFASYQKQYLIAWGLILVNIGIQYLLELRNQKDNPQALGIIRWIMAVLFIEAVMVFIGAALDLMGGVYLSAAAVLFGIIASSLPRSKTDTNIDFAHLTERAMLYVVFTFGEMIIALASYFTGDGSFDFNTVYFSLMAFLIVVGLFLSYGFIYDHLTDREGNYSGLLYMFLHIFIIFMMNNITASLEFMREEEVALLPKMLFLVISLIGYFLFLFLLGTHSKCSCKPTAGFFIKAGVITAGFITLMIVFRENMALNILISVIFVFSIFLIIYFGYRKTYRA